VDALPAADFNPSVFWNLPPGSRVTHTHVAVRGVCPDCAKRKTQTGTAN
jgi:hypothetical protein